MDFTQACLGPKMSALDKRRQTFVWELLKMGGSNPTEAARRAGFPDPGRVSSAVRVRAHEMMHDDRVLDAISEVSQKAFRGLIMPAVVALREVLEKHDHPERQKVALSILSRLGLGEKTGLDVSVTGEIQVNHTDAALEALKELQQLRVPRDVLLERFGFSGLARYERMLAERKPKLIEGEIVSRETNHVSDADLSADELRSDPVYLATGGRVDDGSE